ncbi:MAG: SdrD B-like domain-containing protein [Kiritimatiellae bacterium]|nr:SdrD B-like domain-containing protein [Kiritimatiellia bacterium]
MKKTTNNLFRHAVSRVRGVALAAFFAAFGFAALAAGIAPVQTFYIPLPEDHLLQSLKAIAKGGSGETGTYAPVDPVHSYLSIAVFADETRIYYDQWEDGYDQNIANSLNLYHAVNNPGGTQIWGDNDPSNGIPPGFTTDILRAGDVIILDSEVVSTTRGEVIDFDGGDKIASTKPVAVTRAVWATGSSTMLAGANEVYDTAFWGTAFQCPVGVNIPDNVDFQMFEYTGLSIMAGVGGATVQVDKDLDGIFEVHVLAEGQACLIDGGMHVGGRVISDRPVQVDLITGDISSYYESRFIRLLPTAYWSSSQTTPVATSSNNGTTAWLYNPGDAALSVLYIRRSTSGTLTTNTLTVASGGYTKQILESSASGARFINVDKKPFYAMTTIDSTGASGANDAFDWGFAMVPESSLTSQVLVGLGIGRDPSSTTNPSENGSPVWVTPIGNGETAVTVYVDYDANPATGANTDPAGNKYDAAYSAKELQQLKIYNPSGNQSGMLIYVLKPEVKLSAAWGADPGKASTSAPGLDMGTGIPPFPLYVASKYSELVIDADNDGHISPGDTLRYSIVIENTGRQPVTGLDLQDMLPPGITYLADNTFFVNESSVTNQIADNLLPANQTIFPLDEGGIDLPGSVLPVRSSWEVSYTVTVDAFEALPAGTVSLANTATVGGSGLTVTNSVVDFIHGRIGSFVWWDKNANGLQDAGEPGLNGAAVSLLYPNGAPVLGANGLPMTTVTTNDAQNAPGYYCFAGVKAGDYSVAFGEPPDKYKLTIVNSDGYGVDGEFNSDADPLTKQTAIFSLAAGQIRENIDAGFVKKPGCVSGAVRLDVNGDGEVDTEDIQGIAGVTIKLYNTNTQLVAIATTTVTGEYLFPVIEPGDYTLVQMLPAGYTNTYDVVGANDLRLPVTLISGTCLINQDFYVARVGGGAIGNKVLYLSGPGMAMDRIDPVAAADNTTMTVSLAAPVTAQEITVVGPAAASNASKTASTHSFSYFSGNTGENRILMVGISYNSGWYRNISSVNYGTQRMTEVGTQRNGLSSKIHIYRLLNPNPGSHQLQVNWNYALSQGAVVGAITYAGVSPIAPTDAFISSTGSSSVPSVTVDSDAGHLVFGVIGGRTTSTYTVPTGATQLWSNRPYSGETAGSGQSKAGDDSVSLTWGGSSSEWAAGAVSLNPAPITAGSGDIVTFTQTPQFSLPFTVYSNTVVTVTTYINVTAGTMPANPKITAYLSAGGATYLSRSNSIYNAGQGTLTWSGTAAYDVVVDAGMAISLSVLNEESNVAFDILYNSAAYPSKIVMPTPSIIAIPSLGVYNAAYAGGTPVESSTVGDSRYIRFTVTDPFGAYDITGAALEIDAPGSQGNISLTLDNSHVVATNSHSKTYEYLWQGSEQAGACTITVTANEGSEGIQASSEIKHTLYEPATLYGYLFQDKNGDKIRNADDLAVTNALVSLIVDGKTIATTKSDENGYYFFAAVPAGAVAIKVVQADATLVGLPASDDQMRNRAVPAPGDSDIAVIEYTVEVGAPGEPLNFGYSVHPLSTQLDLRVYAAADGRVMIEIATVNENGNNAIEVYALVDGEWALVATVPADQIAGFGSNTYTVEAFGLMSGASYRFQIVDESGHIFESGLIQVARTLVAVKSLTLTPEMIRLSFTTKPGMAYQVMVCEAIGAPWKKEYVQCQTVRGWSELTNEPFTAGRGETTSVLVPRNGRAKAFFKIIEVQ